MSVSVYGIFKTREMTKLYDITKGVNIDGKRLSSRTEQTPTVRS